MVSKMLAKYIGFTVNCHQEWDTFRCNVSSLNDRIGDIMAEKEQSKIAAHIQPNASQNEVVGFKGGVLQVRIAAPSVKGKANQELIKFLSKVISLYRGVKPVPISTSSVSTGSIAR